MKVFVVTICAGLEAYDLATKVVRESGAANYADAEEFAADGVQDQYRAVDEAHALVWVYTPSSGGEIYFGMRDFNYLYADTVMQRSRPHRETYSVLLLHTGASTIRSITIK